MVNTSNLDKINRKIVFGLVVLVLTLVAVLFLLLGIHIVGRGLSQSASSGDGQTSLLVGHRSSAENRWIEAH
jgi:hypothetical protein